MKLKTIITVGLCIGIIGLAAILIPYIVTYCFSANEIESVGIIGAADSPTARFLTFRLFVNKQFLPVSVFLTLTVISVIYLIFNKVATNGCTLKTTVLSVGASASISAALLGILKLYFSTDLDAGYREQILFSLFRIFVFAFPIIFILLLIFYFLARKVKPSVGGTLLDTVTALLLIVPFTSFFHFITNLFL